jgi:hypothetical protein
MKTAFTIYIRAVGIYALLTLPLLSFAIMYIISLGYVLTFGWFAWLLFTLIYVITDKFQLGYVIKFMLLFFIGVTGSIAFAFNMIGVLGIESDVWHSGFLFFPFIAVVSGWISLFISRKKIRTRMVLTPYYNDVVA